MQWSCAILVLLLFSLLQGACKQPSTSADRDTEEQLASRFRKARDPGQALALAHRIRCLRMARRLRQAGARTWPSGPVRLPRLAGDQARLTLLTLDGRVHRFLSFAGGVRRLPARDLSHLQTLIIKTRDELEHGALEPSFPRLARLLARLHHQLLGGAQLGRTRQLVVAADGMTRLVPFHALVSGQNEGRPRFVADDLAVSYAVCPGLSPPAGLSGRAFVIVPSYAPQRTHLAAVAQEIAAVSRRFPQRTTIHRGGDATLARLLAALGQPGAVVHFAGHGLADLQPGTTPELLLSEDQPPATLARLTRRPVRAGLVVLAACTTAFPALFRDGKRRVAPTGPVEGLLAAGAGAVIASSWNVKDRLSAQQMQVFYQRLGPQDRAMSTSYRELMRRLTSPHPRFWAGYALYVR